MKKFWKQKTGKPASPDDGELLAFLDGELPPQRQAEIRQWLENDWSLRVRLGELERDIAAYVSATHPPAGADAPPFDDLWRKVSAHARQDAEQADMQAVPSFRWRWLRVPAWLQQSARLRLALSAGIALLLVMGLTFWLLRSEKLPMVSAEELMQRATQSEAKSLQRVGDPVVYRKVQLKRAGSAETVQWESWKDARHGGQFRQRIADHEGRRFVRGSDARQSALLPALLMELDAVLRANQFDVERPLSAATFAGWRRQLRQASEAVTEQKEGWRLTTTTAAPPAANAILVASLLVRKSDWHALLLQLRVQGATEVREYELSEIAYDVLPLQALTVFSDLSPSANATPVTMPSVVAASSPSRSPSLPTATALQEAEMAARYALHQARADLGEQLEVTQADRQFVVVRGLVETETRKQQLLDALRALPLVNAQIQTVAEAAQQTIPRVPEAVTLEDKPAAASAFEQRLLRYFQAGGADAKTAARSAADFAHEIVTEAAVIRAEAWALRRLSERYSAEEERTLTPVARQQIAAIVRQHQARLLMRQQNLSARLSPVCLALGGVAATPPAPAAAADWQAATQQVFQAAEQFHRITNQLLAGAGGATLAPEQAAQRLLDALAHLTAVETTPR